MLLLFTAQFLSLLGCIAYHCSCLLVSLPLVLLRATLQCTPPAAPGEPEDSCVFYEGVVTHNRTAPRANNFK